MQILGQECSPDLPQAAHILEVCGVVKFLDEDGVVTYWSYRSDTLHGVEALGMTTMSRGELEAEVFGYGMYEIGFDDDDD